MKKGLCALLCASLNLLSNVLAHITPKATKCKKSKADAKMQQDKRYTEINGNEIVKRILQTHLAVCVVFVGVICLTIVALARL